MTEEWQLQRSADDGFEDLLFDVEVTDTVNRFGRFAIARIDDFEGEKFGDYRRGSAHDIYAPNQNPATDDPRFTGFVAEQHVSETDGADELELDIYSFDHFLRRGQTITEDYSGDTISQALEDIITTFVPAVAWVAGNIDLVNDTTVQTEFDGEKVDNAIARLLAKSANEEFGVNDDREFFARPREISEAPRGIDNTEWLDYDFPEGNTGALNQFRLFYGPEGNRKALQVNDGDDQLQLQQDASLNGPGVLYDEDTREDITDDGDAKDYAERQLGQMETIRRGTVTTFGLFDAEPGQVVPVEISPLGIDDDFRIAEITYLWGRDETILTVVENAGDIDDKLVNITDTLKRVEHREADRTVPVSIFEGPLLSMELFTLTAQVLVRTFGTDRFNAGFSQSLENGEMVKSGDVLGFSQTIERTEGYGQDPYGEDYSSQKIDKVGEDLGIHIERVDTVSETATRVTNTLLNAVRDGWKGDSPPQISDVTVGTGDSSPTRTDTGLENELLSISASVTVSGDVQAIFDASERATQAFSAAELGIEDATDLFGRATVETIDIGIGDVVDYRITVTSADDATEAGVITTTGSGVTRDIIADDSPDTPTQLAFGEDNTDPDVSDTSLGNEFATENIDEFVDREVGTVDVTASTTNSTGNPVTLREWGLKNGSSELLTRIVYADILVEDTDTLNAKQRLRWRND